MAWPLSASTILAPDVWVRRAGPQDARRLAAYHANHSEHLKNWDVGWSEDRTNEAAQALRLQSDTGRWIAWLQRSPGPEVSQVVAQDHPAEGLIELESWPSARCTEGRALTLALSYSCSPAAQGHGIMTHALKAIIALLARDLPNSDHSSIEVLAHVREDNARSERLLERLGFLNQGIDGEFPAVPVEGQWKRHHRWALSLPLSAG